MSSLYFQQNDFSIEVGNHATQDWKMWSRTVIFWREKALTGISVSFRVGSGAIGESQETIVTEIKLQFLQLVFERDNADFSINQLRNFLFVAV